MMTVSHGAATVMVTVPVGTIAGEKITVAVADYPLSKGNGHREIGNRSKEEPLKQP